MKASILLAIGVCFALEGVAASAQAQPPQGADLHMSTRASIAAPQNLARSPDATPPAPRGDLRGDIASNVRAKPDTERAERAQHH